MTRPLETRLERFNFGSEARDLCLLCCDEFGGSACNKPLVGEHFLGPGALALGGLDRSLNLCSLGAVVNGSLCPTEQ